MAFLCTTMLDAPTRLQQMGSFPHEYRVHLVAFHLQKKKPNGGDRGWSIEEDASLLFQHKVGGTKRKVLSDVIIPGWKPKAIKNRYWNYLNPHVVQKIPTPQADAACWSGDAMDAQSQSCVQRWRVASTRLRTTSIRLCVPLSSPCT